MENNMEIVSQKKWAIVTGASSGIGREIAIDLSERGYGIVLVARRAERLIRLSEVLYGESYILDADLSTDEGIQSVIDFVEDNMLDVEILVNNAGFGDLGYFTDTSIDKEVSMIDLNVKSLHILMKYFLRVFKRKNRGYILNVASSAGLMPGGPRMSTYYATKSYVVSLTNGVSTELKDQGIDVYVGALCPGPVDTEFNQVAGAKFAMKGISPRVCARYAVRKMFDRKVIIVPSKMMKAAVAAVKFAPTKMVLKTCLKIQSEK